MLKRIFLYLAKKRLNRVEAVELEKIKIAEGPYICGTPIINFVHLEKRPPSENHSDNEL
jgi:hypothetical protein